MFKFKSKYEKRIYDDARSRGLSIAYEPETFLFNYSVRGGKCLDCGGKRVVKSARYTPDFRLGNGSYVEAKGKFDAKARARTEAFRLTGPSLVLRFILGADNWTTYRHKERISQWLRERGLTSVVGDKIPEEWGTDSVGRPGVCPGTGSGSPTSPLHKPPKRGRVPRNRKAHDLQPRKRNKVHLEGGAKEPGLGDGST